MYIPAMLNDGRFWQTSSSRCINIKENSCNYSVTVFSNSLKNVPEKDFSFCLLLGGSLELASNFSSKLIAFGTSDE